MEAEGKHTESKIQAESYKWFHNEYAALRGLLYHVPNGGARGAIEAAKLQAMGVVPGIPDIVFHYRGKTYFFEFKDATGRVKPEQAKIHDVMRAQGFLVWVVRSVEHFQELIETILADKTDPFKLGVTKEDYYYKHRVFEYLYNVLGHGELVVLNDLVEDVNKVKFIECVKDFMRFRFDEKDSFELMFTFDFEAIYKRVKGQTYEPIFYKGRSIIDINFD